MRAGVTIVGAVGGVGASTLAALLARRRAAGGERVALVDLDVGGGGIEVLLGIESSPGARWADLAGVRGTLDGGDLDGVLPRWHDVEVLSADRRPPADDAAVLAVWHGLAASGRTVVADLPGRVLVAGGEGARLAVAGGVVLLTGQDVLGVAAGVAARDATGARTRLALRRRARARVAPAEAARLLDAPLVGMVAGDRRVAEATDRGFGPMVAGWSPLARSVRRIARELDRA